MVWDQFDEGIFPEAVPDTLWRGTQVVDGRNALVEVVGLLEDYAPTWYTEEHRERAQSALRMIRGC